MFSFRENIKKNKSVILFTNARDEPNIAEWVAHHLLLGFDKIIIFDHLSNPPIQQTITTTFDNKLQIIPINNKVGTNFKLDLMKNALKIANKLNFDWMLYLDADEFICLNKHSNIKDYLMLFNYADAIGVNWVMFGTNGHEKQPNGLLMENFTSSEAVLDIHIKSFVRPYSNVSVVNPHYYIISNKNKYFSGNGKRINMGPFHYEPTIFTHTYIYIAHYYTQSKEEHLRRKSRVLDDGSVNKADAFIKQLDSLYNNVPNNQLQHKYANNTREFLKKYGIIL
jgi:hypothetical protein